jgi:hypothetical protein
LALSSWAFFAIGVVTTGVTTIGVIVVIATVRGNLCCYTYTNQQSQDKRSWEK